MVSVYMLYGIKLSVVILTVMILLVGHYNNTYKDFLMMTLLIITLIDATLDMCFSFNVISKVIYN
jgi:hypothetical protein